MGLKRNKGFTLVELVLIIALLATITALAAPNIFTAENKAKEEACRDQMDFLLQGFQNEQLHSDSIYAFTSVDTDGLQKLQAYIDLATSSSPSDYINVGFEEQVVCPSGQATNYQAKVKDDQLYVYCPIHDEYSHTGLMGRPEKSDTKTYTDLDAWIGTDNNWIVGDHESFFVLPIKDQYYHAEIGFKFFVYDDGTDEEGDPITEYRYDDPDWYLEIPLTSKDTELTTGSYSDTVVNPIYEDGKTRPLGYNIDGSGMTTEGLAFALAIDFQETEDGFNFSSNSLELKNIKSNAAEDFTLDIMKESVFSPEATMDKPHNRDFFDGYTDWLIMDIVPYSDDYKKMVIHMMNDSNVMQLIFEELVPVAKEENGDVKFAFFMGKRVEDAVIDVIDKKKVKNDLYFPDGYPAPVQVMIDEFIIDYDGIDNLTSKSYEYWYGTDHYVHYADSHEYMK
jgi:type II secretory pathway pseudopilin PulG